MSDAAALFELAKELSILHSRAALGAITVVPVVVEDLARAAPVLDAVATLANGTVLLTSRPELQGPVLGTTDVVRLKAIQRALTARPTSSRHVVILDTGGGMVDAAFEEPPAGTDPSPGERAVLAVARAAAHRDLDDREMVIVGYADKEVDILFRRPVWDMAVLQLAGIPNATLKTLVFVAEADIDIGMHCRTDYGFAFAIEAGRFVRRYGGDDLAAWCVRLTELDKPFLLFLGAGFSASSGLPVGNGLRDEAIKRMLGLPPDSAKLAERFHDWIAAKPGWLSATELAGTRADYIRDLTLEQVIRAERRMYPGDGFDLPTLQTFHTLNEAAIKKPGASATDLASVATYHDGRIILATVNFDRLLETTLGPVLRVFASDAEFAALPDYLKRYLSHDESQIPLLKFHGTIDRPETCVVSAEDTERGLSEPKLLALRALLEIGRMPWLYVGMSMRDKDLVPVLQGRDFGDGTEEAWINPYMIESIERFTGTRLEVWRHRDPINLGLDRLITETSDSFFAAWRGACEVAIAKRAK